MTRWRRIFRLWCRRRQLAYDWTACPLAMFHLQEARRSYWRFMNHYPQRMQEIHEQIRKYEDYAKARRRSPLDERERAFDIAHARMKRNVDAMTKYLDEEP